MATACKTGYLVPIKRTQASFRLKFQSRFFGPYRVVKVLRNDRYTLQQEGEHEEPKTTSTVADHLKLWN